MGTSKSKSPKQIPSAVAHNAEGSSVPSAVHDPVEEIQAIAELGKVLTSTLELSVVLQEIMGILHGRLKASQWSLLLKDSNTGRLRFEVTVGEGAEAINGCSIDFGEGVAGWVAQNEEPLLVKDASSDSRWCDRFDSTSGYRTGSVLAVPLKSRGDLLGVIELVAGVGEPCFEDNDQRFLSLIAGFAAIGIQNAQAYARMEALSLEDEHTSLYNSRYLQQSLAAEIGRGRRYGHAVSLVFFDLDRFKSVNDEHGHLAGSALLAEIGDVLRGSCRQTDVPCRYGGDEFVVLLPETSRDGAIVCADRIRKAIASRPFLIEKGGAIRITASFGVATFPDDADDVESLLGGADSAMYRAKADGRDAVRVVNTQKTPEVGGE